MTRTVDWILHWFRKEEVESLPKQSERAVWFMVQCQIFPDEVKALRSGNSIPLTV